jgi:hypothetical protein
VEREYQEQRAERPSGTAGKTATAGLRSEVKSDVSDVRTAVDNLRTTTPENWWDRHMTALRMGFDDVESDVKRFTGARTLPGPPKTSRVADASGEPVSTEPFTSSRDKFVADMHARVDAMKKPSTTSRPPAHGKRSWTICARGSTSWGTTPIA